MLRDYLTDLFPILELGTSAKMLSIVPLMNGGGLFETGAGGSAPKHVQQFVQGEPPALGLARRVPGPRRLARAPRRCHRQRPGRSARRPLSTRPPARCSTRTSPRRARSDELDNRGSHFYLALYWAQELAAQTDDAGRWRPRSRRWPTALAEQRAIIVDELIAAQGKPVDIGGYYSPDPELVEAAMRPSATFNALLAEH